MSKALYLTAVLCSACGSFAGGIYASTIKTDSKAALDACAKANNVYALVWKAVPKEELRLVYVKPDLLPPPEGE